MSTTLRRRYGKAKGEKRKLSAQLPDGVLVTRTTTHPYTHVVAGQLNADDYWVVERGHKAGSWYAAQWTTQPQKALAAKRRNRPSVKYELVPVLEAT